MKRFPIKVREAIEEFKEGLLQLYGDRLKMLLLYGSYAKGEATPDSDIDLMIVLKGEVKEGKEIDRMIDLITDINLKYGELISVVPISEEKFRTSENPFVWNAKKEGVILLKK